MNRMILMLLPLAAMGVVACDRPAVVVAPVTPVAVPGPPGPQGATGSTGSTGMTGSTGPGTTVIVVPPAASAPSN